MKTVVISRKDKELARFYPDRRSHLIGRSPSCEVVMRSKGIKPIHYLMEWIGEGEFDPDSGFWTVIDISQQDSKDKNKSSGEGFVLSQEPIKVDDLEFKVIIDELSESNLKKGVLSRTLDRLKDNEQTKFGKVSCLEIIYFRKDVERVTNVLHVTSQQKSHFHLLFPSLRNIHLHWNHENNNLPILQNKNESNDFQVYLRSENITSLLKEKDRSLPLKANDLVVISSSNFDYYIRMVPFIEVTTPKGLWLKDPVVQTFIVLFLFLSLLGIWMSQQPVQNMDLVKPPERIATIEIKETAPLPEIKQEEPLITKNDKVEKPVEKIQEKAEEQIQIKSETKKDVAASAASVKNSENTKNKAGLNNPAPIKDVNTVGLLGKLKGGVKSDQTVSAEVIMNKGIVSEGVSGSTGFVISQPPAGLIGKGKQGGGDGSNANLAAASTTLQNSKIVDENSVGALAVGKGTSQFSSGTQLSGLQGSGGNRQEKNLAADSGSMEVAGGLDKEAVRTALRENTRAIRNCYETALLSRKELEGRMVLKWKIAPDGRVDTIGLQSSSLNIPSLENCVSEVVKGIVFPQAPNQLATTVIYPFVFQGKR